jgi:hypothetical protein
MQIWQWESHKHREQATENLANNPAWEEYTKYEVEPVCSAACFDRSLTARHGIVAVLHRGVRRTVKPMLQHQKYSIILQFPFWPLEYPETKGGIYELRFSPSLARELVRIIYAPLTTSNALAGRTA